MKHIFRRLMCLLIVVMLAGVVLNDGCVVQYTYAAMTPQQKAAAAKKKAAEKRKKEAAKKKAAAAKKKAADAKKKAVASKQTSNTKTTSASSLSKEEAYQLKVAEIEKYNAHVAAYMSRDISHRLGFSLQGGYSSIFPSMFDADGYQPKAKGWIGGGAGFDYQLRYKRFLFQTGLEFQTYNSMTAVNTLTQTFGMEPYGDKMTFCYDYADVKDKWRTSYIQLPLLFGMEFADKNAYFLAGPKVGYSLTGHSDIEGNMTTTIIDKEAIDPFQQMDNHALVNGKHLSANQNVKFGLNLALAAEVGICLDKWMQPKTTQNKRKSSGQALLERMHTRLALFAEYGALNIMQPGNVNTSYALTAPVDYTKVLSGENPVEQASMVSAVQARAAKDARLNPFMVGVKFSMLFDLPRKDLKTKSLPKEPNPRMIAQVTNAEDGKPLSASTVTIWSDKREPMQKTVNSKGFITAAMPKGQYYVKADKVGFFVGDTLTYNLQRDLMDTMIIALVPEPKPIVYTYCGYVFKEDDHLPAEAEVKVYAVGDSVNVLYAGAAADDGLFVTDLLEGKYVTHIRYAGYLPLEDTVDFVQDTVRFNLTKIKEGIRIRINNLFFATNKTFILPESENAMNDLALFLSDNPTVRILIVGHTDNVGKERYNQRLSEGRAASVKTDLIRRGIDPNRIETEGRGMSEPVADNATEEGRALNRRVEYTIIDTGGEDIQLIDE